LANRHQGPSHEQPPAAATSSGALAETACLNSPNQATCC